MASKKATLFFSLNHHPGICRLSSKNITTKGYPDLLATYLRVADFIVAVVVTVRKTYWMRLDCDPVHHAIEHRLKLKMVKVTLTTSTLVEFLTPSKVTLFILFTHIL